MFKAKNVLDYIIGSAKKIHKSKYFYSSIIVLGFCAALVIILYVGSAPTLSELKEGDVSLRTIYAPYDFNYPTAIDEKKTEEVRGEFESKISPVYDIDESVEKKVYVKLDGFFDSVKEVQGKLALDHKAKIENLKTKITSTLPDKELAKFIESKDPDGYRKISKDTLENIFLFGIIDADNKKKLLGEKEAKVSMRNPRFKLERELKVKELVDEKEAKKIVYDTLQRELSKDRSMRNTLYALIKSEVAKNIQFNEQETRQRKVKARSEVLPIYKQRVVKKNELIVEKGKRLTKNDIVKLTQITSIRAIVNRTSYLFGLTILFLGLTMVVMVYLLLLERKLIQTPKYVLLISINAFFAILISLVIIQSQQPIYLIPLAGIGMILVLLLNVNAALITSLALSIYIGFLAGGKLGLGFVLFVGSALGIYAVRGAKRRSQIFFAGFVISIVNFFSIAGIGLLNNLGKEAILRESFFGIANGIISSFIVIGLLPVFEYTFNLITNITLLELSDLSHPLLKELTIKAPGTYHHSILVGNLAEEACNAIGANPLLARVGAYYHDIGKMEKAEYFVENETGTPSKHKKLTPSMSALIITNHTRDGVELARKHKLNSAIIDFISQHHGTSLIYYFYQRALEKDKSGEGLKEEEFRYDGPKPQTEEAAIILLADSVEASSRMLSDPTPARIRGLVQKIINNKFIDGQLDECELTLSGLNKISESFVRVLTGVFHTRLDYPEIKSKKERKNASKSKDKQSE